MTDSPETLQEIRDIKRIMTEQHTENVQRLTRIETILDYNGGLIATVQNNVNAIAKLRKNYWLLVGLLVGSGAIGVGTSLLVG